MIHFCTLFDRNYLYRGLAMHESLSRYCAEFHLFILCFDDITYEVLGNMSLPHTTLITLEEFEDGELRRVKQDRTVGEYCWTCTSSLLLYVFNKYTEVQELTYLDADLMFFSSPQPLFKEMGDGSILITPHRYSRQYDQSDTSGIYCVQYLTFKRDDRGFKALNWWRERCIEWCYNRVEDGKFGDQKYLDDWPERFEGVVVSDNIGAGVAPWNVRQYKITRDGDRLFAGGKKIVFYHYHFFKCYTNGQYDLGMYEIPKEATELIYRPYIAALKDVKSEVQKLDVSFDYGVVEKYGDWTYPLRYLYRRIRGYYHVIE